MKTLRKLVLASTVWVGFTMVLSQQVQAQVFQLEPLVPDAGYGTPPATFTPQADTGVDGVFRPLNAGLTTISSTGITADLTSLSLSTSTFGSAWADNNVDAGGLDPVISPPTTVVTTLFAHANAGITFDLDDIVPGGEMATAFTGFVGNTDGDGVASLAYAILVDGTIVASGLDLSNQQFDSLNIPLTTSNRFLTLITSDGNGNIGNDHGVFINPNLTTAPIPEPQSILGLGAAVFLGTAFTFRFRNTLKGQLKKAYPISHADSH